MKIAEEFCHTKLYIEQALKDRKCNCLACQHLREVQLDAWRQGMSDAAEIAKPSASSIGPVTRILSARDNKKEI